VTGKAVGPRFAVDEVVALLEDHGTCHARRW